MPELPFDPPNAPPLRSETVVFSGKLWSFGRKEARALVEELGGATDEEVTVRTTLLVVGAASYPDGAPDLSVLLDDSSTQSQKLRRVAQINADTPGRIRVLSEDEFCRLAGQPAVAERRTQHYGQKDVLAMYPALRLDHLRYMEKCGLIKPAFKNNADTFFGFGDLTTLRQMAGELQQGIAFRAALRSLQASRVGQLAFDFRLDAQPARIINLKSRAGTSTSGTLGTVGTLGTLGTSGTASGARELSGAEQYFLMGSLMDDGTPERVDEAVKAYRRALEEEPDLVAALINLANIRYSRDELAEAQALYERAIVLDPSYFEAHFNLGNIHHDHAHYGEAEVSYREALALNNSYPDAHFYLAVTLEKMGRSVDARAHWRAYERLAPQGEWVELAKEFSD
ncbi:MAG: tetratricopeptide repeat protein [Acidobacteriota bacterium]|nr:tetratricopeptide repeat protein [Acidobacteriota bacterium]